jgi:hypothetical protein
MRVPEVYTALGCKAGVNIAPDLVAPEACDLSRVVRTEAK